MRAICPLLLVALSMTACLTSRTIPVALSPTQPSPQTVDEVTVALTFLGSSPEGLVFETHIENRSSEILPIDPAQFRCDADMGAGKQVAIAGIDPDLRMAQLDALAAGGIKSHRKASALRALEGAVNAVAAVAEDTPEERVAHTVRLAEIGLEQEFAAAHLEGRLAQLEGSREDWDLNHLRYALVPPGHAVTGLVTFPVPGRAYTATIHVAVRTATVTFPFESGRRVR